ncbi:MAG: hypothetical protein PVH02_03500 [Desulfobacteraceae bacterium]|jgi:hypothetical protein
MFSSHPFPSFLSSLLTCFLFLSLSGCATLYKPLPDRDVEVILASIQAQERKVFSFYTTGGLSLQDRDWESESHVLIVGNRNPFRIKIEVTHPWGRPIVHILIDERNLQVLSFAEKRLYLGAFTPETLSKFLPGELDAHLVWAVLRGYPHLLSYHGTISMKANQIRLLDEKGRALEIIDLYPESKFPRMVFFPAKNIGLGFSDFQQIDGIYYARKVKVKDMGGKSNLILRNRKMVFNKTIPKEVFHLEKPPSFGAYRLEKKSNEAGPSLR